MKNGGDPDQVGAWNAVIVGKIPPKRWSRSKCCSIVGMKHDDQSCLRLLRGPL